MVSACKLRDGGRRAASRSPDSGSGGPAHRPGSRGTGRHFPCGRSPSGWPVDHTAAAAGIRTGAEPDATTSLEMDSRARVFCVASEPGSGRAWFFGQFRRGMPCGMPAGFRASRGGGRRRDLCANRCRSSTCRIRACWRAWRSRDFGLARGPRRRRGASLSDLYAASRAYRTLADRSAPTSARCARR